MHLISVKIVFFRSFLTGFVFSSLVLLAAGRAYGATYYIDCANGADKNNGTSQSSPWLRHPYMVGWSGNYTHSAGDHYLFKGGVVCPVQYLPLTLAAGGTSGNIDFYGADQTWYVGSAWSRPIFDGSSTGPSGSMFEGSNRNYWTVDSIEFRNQGVAPGAFVYAVHGYGGTGLTVNNVYIHGWRFTGACTGGSDSKPGGVYLSSGGSTNTLSNSTIDGTGSGPSGGAFQGPIAFGNTIHDIPNGIINGFVMVYNNTIYNITTACDPTQHENAIETLSDTVTSYIYDNVIYGVAAGVVLLVCGNVGIFNNVMYGNTPYDIQIDTNCSGDSSASAVVYNNTLQGTGGLVRVVNRGATLGSLTLVNNHYITDASGNPACYKNTAAGCSNVMTVVDGYPTNNIKMTNSSAAVQGYASGEAHAYSPTSATNRTVAAGLNLTTSCSSLAALCSSISGMGRPASGAWDVGAYLFITQPNPPMNLTATPR